MRCGVLKGKTEKLISLCRKICACGERIVITGHDIPDADSVISCVMMKKMLSSFGIDSSIKFVTQPDGVTERDMRELGLMSELSFGEFEADERLLLVDHHATPYGNAAFACVDHHTTPPKPQLELSVIVSASSCGRVIFDMSRSCGLTDSELERLAIYSVYLDTQSCRSPKFQKGDAEWLEYGIAKHGIDRECIERMGLCLNSLDEESDVLSMYGYKKYSFGGRCAFSTCIQVDGDELEWSIKVQEILKILQKRLGGENGCVWAFVVNKPTSVRSDIYFIYRDGCTEKLELDRLASRSRDVVPVAERACLDGIG